MRIVIEERFFDWGEGIEAAESLTNNILNIKPFHYNIFELFCWGEDLEGNTNAFLTLERIKRNVQRILL